MSKEIKQKADEVVNMFIKYVESEIAGDESFIFDLKTQTDNATQCAILHQERLIEELVLNSGYVSDFYRFNYLDNIKIQKAILTELKSRL
jgi:hypothetical protein